MFIPFMLSNRTGSIPVRFSFIVSQGMTQEKLPTIFAAEERARWRALEPEIWSIQGADLDSVPTQSILTTLWDQPRWLEAYHLYDQRGSELFEQICELPEYYLTRTENAILEKHASDIIARAPVRCIVELGAGYSKKTVHLLTEQLRQRGSSIFAPIDVSAAGLRHSRATTCAPTPGSIPNGNGSKCTPSPALGKIFASPTLTPLSNGKKTKRFSSRSAANSIRSACKSSSASLTSARSNTSPTRASGFPSYCSKKKVRQGESAPPPHRGANPGGQWGRAIGAARRQSSRRNNGPLAPRRRAA